MELCVGEGEEEGGQVTGCSSKRITNEKRFNGASLNGRSCDGRW